MDRSHAYGAGFAVVGVVLAAVQIIHGLAQTDWVLVLAFEAGPFVLLSLALTFAGGWLAVNPDYEQDLPRILAWAVGASILFASVAALMLFSQRVALGTLERGTFITIDLVTVGAVVGTIVGLYDVRGVQRMRALRRERDRIETFGQKAADVNNYGRALNRSKSIHDVSALIIEAMGSLLEVTDVAVILAGESYDVVDNTAEVSMGTLEAITDRTLGEDEATILTHGEDFAEDGETPISILLLSGDDYSVVLVAFAEGPRFDEENVQLLELLASHASTALSGIVDRETDELTRTASREESG